LIVSREADRLVLDFPSQPAREVDAPEILTSALGIRADRVLKARDYYAVLKHAKDVSAQTPDLGILAQLDGQGVVVTAPGEDCDFVSRYFAPKAGIPEDPATGSTHCSLIPYWSQRLGKKVLHARQLSKRGGEFFCEDRDERVRIGGNTVTYVEGRLHCA
jgi:predicted PhzF superfamily epimerase YddE/YHI9